MDKSSMKAPVIGFVRYSQKVKFGNSKIERDVFEPEYFEYRFKIFENITLSSFQQQTNQDFILILLHSENMPDEYKKRFELLEEQNFFLRNVYLEDNEKSYKDAIRKSIGFVSFINNHSITFRIDNDDAVQKDFINILSGYIKKEFFGHAICLPSVFIVKRVSDMEYVVEDRYYPSNSIGLAYITNKDQYKTIMEFKDHTQINNDTPVLLLEKKANYGLMTINGENEANEIENSSAKLFNRKEIYNYLSSMKITNLNLECLRIFNEPTNSSTISFKEITKLLLPPILIKSYKKIRYF